MIFLTAPMLDWGQSVGMAVSVQRVVYMFPHVIVIDASNDQLQSPGLLTRRTDLPSILSNEVIGDAIKKLLSAMTERRQQRSTRNSVNNVLILSQGAIETSRRRINVRKRGHGRGDNDAFIGHDRSNGVNTAMLHQQCGENHLYNIT